MTKITEVEKAFLILLTYSMKITERETHKNDMVGRKKQYLKILEDFRIDSKPYINDCIDDIRSLYDW